MIILRKLLPIMFTCIVSSMVTFWAFAAPHGATVDLLTETDTTILGQPFEYPEGRAKITSVILSVPPNTTLKLHYHPVPVFGYMLQGELTVNYGEKGERTYRKGDTLVEAFNTLHQGRNASKGNVEILVVYAGANGVPNTVLDDSEL
ncbi:MAG: cupin domain-containing protein [Gammaproteobacteria bacterium]|nr:cupin domain-containing protein [Gammaproteobacteria bacterium]